MQHFSRLSDDDQIVMDLMRKACADTTAILKQNMSLAGTDVSPIALGVLTTSLAFMAACIDTRMNPRSPDHATVLMAALLAVRAVFPEGEREPVDSVADDFRALETAGRVSPTKSGGET